MCGRYTLTALFDDIIELFQIPLVDEPLFQPRYNIAPTQPIIALGKNRKLEFMVWGLIPSWSKDARIGAKLINARAETLAEKSSFRTAFKRRRCLIPASGFYEWQTAHRRKQPFFIHPRKEKIFAFAGLWEDWQGPNGEEIRSCTIITTRANELMKPLHDRMPVILHRKDFDAWLDPANENSEALTPLLEPYPAADMDAIPVGSRVNSVKNEGPDCLAPPASEPSLFD